MSSDEAGALGECWGRVPDEAGEETAGSFVIWRAAGMVCTVPDTLIPLFNLSERTLVSLISKFLWK